jgi:hypothetical protein
VLATVLAAFALASMRPSSRWRLFPTEATFRWGALRIVPCFAPRLRPLSGPSPRRVPAGPVALVSGLAVLVSACPAWGRRHVQLPAA